MPARDLDASVPYTYPRSRFGAQIGGCEGRQQARAKELVQDDRRQDERGLPSRRGPSSFHSAVYPEHLGENAQERPPVEQHLDPTADQACEETGSTRPETNLLEGESDEHGCSQTRCGDSTDAPFDLATHHGVVVSLADLLLRVLTKTNRRIDGISLLEDFPVPPSRRWRGGRHGLDTDVVVDSQNLPERATREGGMVHDELRSSACADLLLQQTEVTGLRQFHSKGVARRPYVFRQDLPDGRFRQDIT